MDEIIYLTSPRPTSGQHFSDYFMCPQRAWLHYYGNPKYQVDDPSFLYALQREGIEHEKNIYQIYYPNALRVPERKHPNIKHNMTLEAINSGEPVILQGYLETDECVGVIDILEINSLCSGSKGHKYQVGEIKRSPKLMTYHVMQAAWYTELLKNVYGHADDQVFFFLKNGIRELIPLDSIRNDYEKVKKSLFHLRETRISPGPHLISMCPSCHWRGVCMPILKTDRHISLIPGVSRKMVNSLKEVGVRSWDELYKVKNFLLDKLELGTNEINNIFIAINCLQNNKPPLKQSLKKDIFKTARIIVLEFPDIARQRRLKEELTVSNIYFEADDGCVNRLEVNLESGSFLSNLQSITNNRKLIFYGGTDRKAFNRIAHQVGLTAINSLDLFDIIDANLHSPVQGFELEELFNSIFDNHIIHLNAPNRVIAIRSVINWISSSL